MKYFFLLSAFMLLVSCGEHQPPRGLIPEKDMEKILTDIHIADAITQMGEIRQKTHYSDSLRYAQQVLGRYGYTLKQFDSTISWYAGYPEEFNKLYEKVINRLSREEGDLTAHFEDSLKTTSGANLWNGKDNYKLPEEGQQSKINFNIPFYGPGIYCLSAEIKIYPDDQAINPHMTAWVRSEKDPEAGRRMFPFVPVRRDNLFSTYTLCDTIKDSTYTSFEGFVLDHTPMPGLWKKHAEVKNITIHYNALYESPMSKEDSLKIKKLPFRLLRKLKAE